jgi:hypothetical protein
MNVLLKEFMESGEFWNLFYRKIHDWRSPLTCFYNGCERAISLFEMPDFNNQSFDGLWLEFESEYSHMGPRTIVHIDELESFLNGETLKYGIRLCGKGFKEFRNILDCKLAEIELFYQLENQYDISEQFDNTKDLYQVYLNEIEKRLDNQNLSELEKFSYWQDQHTVRFFYEQLYIEVHKDDIVFEEIVLHGFHAKAYIDK